MAIIDKFTEEEYLEYMELKEKMLTADSTDEIQYFEKRIQNIFDHVENRTKLKDAKDVGRLEIINNLLNSGMSLTEVIKYTPYSAEELQQKLKEYKT